MNLVLHLLQETMAAVEVIDLTAETDDGQPEVNNHSTRTHTRRIKDLIVSIDVGSVNLAFVCVDGATREVYKWQICSEFSQCSSIVPAQVSKRAFMVVELILNGLHFQNCKVFIESQPPRSGVRGREMTVYKNAIMETALHTAFESRGIEHVSVSSLSVQKFFKLPGGYRHKKAAAAKLVGEIVSGVKDKSDPQFTLFIPQDVLQEFQGTHKKDDLADALLQALYACNGL